MVSRKKVISILLIFFLVLVISIYQNAKSDNITFSGKSCIFNGRSYEIYQGLKVNNYSNKVGQVGSMWDRIDFFEISNMNKDNWLGIKYRGSLDLFVLKENNTPWISLIDFCPKEIQSEDSSTKIKDAKKIEKLISTVDTKEQKYIDLGHKLPKEYHLFSDKYPSLIYIIYYYEMNNGKKYIVDYYNNHDAGSIYEIVDFTLD